MRFGLLLAGSVLLSSALARMALAEPSAAAEVRPALRVILKGCSEFKESEVERVLSAELAADTLPSGAREPTWVVVRCNGSHVGIEVHDPLSRKAVLRSFDFGKAPARGRARLVGIAAAELVLASWAELAVLPAPRVEPEGAAPEPQQQRAAVERIAPAQRPKMLLGTDPELARYGVSSDGARIVYGDYDWERLPARTVSRAVALASTRGFLATQGLLLGGGLRFGTDFSPLYGVMLDALVEGGTLGSGADAVIGESYALGGALYLVADLGRRVTLRGGAGLRSGLMRSRREGSSESVNRLVFWGWPMLALSSTFDLSRMVVELSVEGGYVSLPVMPGANGSSVSGVWLSSQLGVGIKL